MAIAFGTHRLNYIQRRTQDIIEVIGDDAKLEIANYLACRDSSEPLMPAVQESLIITFFGEACRKLASAEFDTQTQYPSEKDTLIDALKNAIPRLDKNENVVRPDFGKGR